MQTVLTPRQWQAVTLLAEGYSGKEIADKMGISGDTLKHHLMLARDLAGARNSTHLAVMFARAQVAPCRIGPDTQKHI